MGNNLSEEEKYEKKYREVKKEIHPVLGEICQVQHCQTHRLYTAKKIITPKYDPQVFALYLASSTTNALVNLHEVFHASQEGFCISQTSLIVIMDDVETDLQSIVYQRASRPWNEAEILNLLVCVLTGIVQCQQRGKSIVSLTPKSIILQSGVRSEPRLEQNIFKVIPLQIATYLHSKKFLYQSNFYPYTECHPKTHIYQLGMVVLDLITNPLEELSSISFQDRISLSLDEQYDKLSILQNSLYSTEITEIIREMVRERESERIGLISLLDRCKSLLNTENNKNDITFSCLSLNTEEKAFPLRKYSKKSKRVISSLKLKENNPSLGKEDKKPAMKHKIIQFENGARYEGELNQKGEFEGQGVLYYPSQQICYFGSWKNNMFSGYGKLFSRQFYSEKQTRGTETIQSSQTRPHSPKSKINYINFSENKMNEWSHFEGEFIKDRKNGQGILWFMNSEKFQGKFWNDLVDGSGRFLKYDGSVIEGVWKKNKLIKISQKN